jgi:hypothetical protein
MWTRTSKSPHALISLVKRLLEASNGGGLLLGGGGGGERVGPAALAHEVLVTKPTAMHRETSVDAPYDGIIQNLVGTGWFPSCTRGAVKRQQTAASDDDWGCAVGAKGPCSIDLSHMASADKSNVVGLKESTESGFFSNKEEVDADS